MKSYRFLSIISALLILTLISIGCIIKHIHSVLAITATTPIGYQVIKDSIILNVVELLFFLIVAYAIGEVIYKETIFEAKKKRFVKSKVENMFKSFDKMMKNDELTKNLEQQLKDAEEELRKVESRPKYPVSPDAAFTPEFDKVTNKAPFIGQPQLKFFPSYSEYHKALGEWYDNLTPDVKAQIDEHDLYAQVVPDYVTEPDKFKVWYSSLPEYIKPKYTVQFNRLKDDKGSN